MEQSCTDLSPVEVEAIKKKKHLQIVRERKECL